MDELKNVVIGEEENNLPLHDNNEAYYLLAALAKSKQTQVRFCDSKCYIPHDDEWATKVIDKFEQMATKEVDGILQDLQEIENCSCKNCRKECSDRSNFFN